jgi:hypothetical protein
MSCKGGRRKVAKDNIHRCLVWTRKEVEVAVYNHPSVSHGVCLSYNPCNVSVKPHPRWSFGARACIMSACVTTRLVRSSPVHLANVILAQVTLSQLADHCSSIRLVVLRRAANPHTRVVCRTERRSWRSLVKTVIIKSLSQQHCQPQISSRDKYCSSSLSVSSPAVTIRSPLNGIDALSAFPSLSSVTDVPTDVSDPTLVPLLRNQGRRTVPLLCS